VWRAKQSKAKQSKAKQDKETAKQQNNRYCTNSSAQSQTTH